MNKDFDWIEKIERGDTTLAVIIQPCRFMEKRTAEYSRKYSTAMYALAFITVALFISRLARTHNPSLDDVVMGSFIHLIGFGICAAMLLFVRHTMITRPYERYRKALAKAYPGLDTSSEGSMRSYVWRLADEPKRFLTELCAFIGLAVAARELADEEPGEIYASPEGTVLNVWQTNSLEREMDDLGQYHEHEIAYLENAIGSFREVGADEEAEAWGEVLAIFLEVEERRKRDGDEAADMHLNDSEVRERLSALEERLTECRPETEVKLRDYALQHKYEFDFEACE